MFVTEVSSPRGRLALHIRGDVSEAWRRRARAAITAVLADHRVPAGSARLRLAGAPHTPGPVLVQVNLRVCGAPARVQVSGRDVAAAIEAGAERLDRQVRRLTTTWRPWSWPDPHRPALALSGQGRIVRLKTFRLYTGTACQAVAIMDAMDYDVFLYTDAETGQDAAVYRAGPTGLRLARQRSMHPPRLPVLLPMTVHSRQPPVLTTARAAERLADGRWPFVFFTDPGTGRGALLYRRYDGDLGLIGPVLDDPGRR